MASDKVITSDHEYDYAENVTLNDSADLTNVARALYIGVGGVLRVTLYGNTDGTSIEFQNVPVGIFRMAVKRVWYTHTTASSIVALR